jgi:5-oxoprolinase (ATP-hydrolysing)
MSGFKFSIDRGGTFTDVVAITPNNEFRTIKLLSEDPANYKDAPTEGKDSLITQEAGKF